MLRNSKGFTLIELMVVILIVGILAALAIPKFTNASAKAKISEIPTIAQAFENAQMARVAETGSVGALTDLVFDIPGNAGVTKWFTWTSPAAGQYQASAINAIGDFGANQTASTTINALSQVTHASSDSADLARLLPNFF